MNKPDECNDDRKANNMSVYCTASKITLLQWHIMSADPPGIMFLKFICETEYLINTLIINGNTRPPSRVVCR